MLAPILFTHQLSRYRTEILGMCICQAPASTGHGFHIRRTKALFYIYICLPVTLYSIISRFSSVLFFVQLCINKYNKKHIFT